VPCNKGGGVGVLPFAKRIRFPRVWELVRVRPGVAVKGSGAHIISGYVRVKKEIGGLFFFFFFFFFFLIFWFFFI